MQWRHVLLLSFIILLFVLGCTSNVQKSSQETDSLEVYFGALAALSQFNGEIYLERNGEVIIEQVFHADEFPAIGRVESGAIYHIASIRKLMNQYLVLQNPPVPNFSVLPLSSWMDDPRIHPDWTLDMLLNHKSGLPRGEAHEFGSKAYSLQETKELILNQSLRSEPGDEYYYSNFGYLLIDIALSEWFSLHPNEIFAQHIFDPLNLHHTMVHQRAIVQHNLAIGVYYPEPLQAKVAEQEKFEQFESGDTYASVTDLARFAKAIQAPDMINDGVIEHAGAKRGYRSYLYRNLETDTTFVMLSNTTAVPITQVIADVKRLLAGKAVKIPRKIERTAIEHQPDIAASIAGEYILAINGQHLILGCTPHSLYIQELDDESTRQPLFFETSTVLFSQPHSEDGFLIYYAQGEPRLSAVGMGGAEFPMQRISELECYDESE